MNNFLHRIGEVAKKKKNPMDKSCINEHREVHSICYKFNVKSSNRNLAAKEDITETSELKIVV